MKKNTRTLDKRKVSVPSKWTPPTKTKTPPHYSRVAEPVLSKSRNIDTDGPPDYSPAAKPAKLGKPVSSKPRYTDSESPPENTDSKSPQNTDSKSSSDYSPAPKPAKLGKPALSRPRSSVPLGSSKPKSKYKENQSGSSAKPWGEPSQSAAEPPVIKRVGSMAVLAQPEMIKPLLSSAAKTVGKPRKEGPRKHWILPKPTNVKRVRLKFNGKETVRQVQRETVEERLAKFREFREEVKDRDETLWNSLIKILRIHSQGYEGFEPACLSILELLEGHPDLMEEFSWECTYFLNISDDYWD